MSGTILAQVSASQANKEVTVNENFTAAAPAGLFGRRAPAISGLTWAYYGGQLYVDGVATPIANGTVDLTDNATNYIEATRAGVVSKNTAGFSAGSTPLYTAVTSSGAITSYEDRRAVGERFVRSRASKGVAGGAGTTILTRDEAAVDILEFTGALTGNRTIEVPAVPWPWIIYNNTSGAFTLTVKTNAGTGIAVPQGKRQRLHCDGTNVVDSSSAISALDVAGALTVGGLLDLSGASAGQIKFPATQNPSADANTLDDCERGTWTIGASFATPGDLALSAETKEAYYIRIGRNEFLYWHYTFTPTFTTSAGGFRLTGMPHAHRDVTNANCLGRGNVRHNAAVAYPAGATMVQLSGIDNSTIMVLNAQGSASATATLSVTAFVSGAAVDLHGSLTYEAA